MSIRARRLSDGRITYDIRFQWQGREIWECAVSNVRREAARIQARRRKEVAGGTYVPPALSPITRAGEFIRSWLDRRTNRNADNDRAYIEHYVLSRQWFTELPMLDVRPRHALRLAEELHKQVGIETKEVLAPKTVANIVGNLRTAFRDAQIQELILANPFVLPKGMLKRRAREERKPYSVDAIQCLTGNQVMAARRIWNALAFYTGMREGEGAERHRC